MLTVFYIFIIYFSQANNIALLLDERSPINKTATSMNGPTFVSHEMSETPPHLVQPKASIPITLEIYANTMKKLSKRFYKWK